MSKRKNKERVDIIIDVLMSVEKLEYIELFADVVDYIETGRGFDKIESKVDEFRQRQKGGVH